MEDNGNSNGGLGGAVHSQHLHLANAVRCSALFFKGCTKTFTVQYSCSIVGIANISVLRPKVDIATLNIMSVANFNCMKYIMLVSSGESPPSPPRKGRQAGRQAHMR